MNNIVKQKDRKIIISVIIPCYNSDKNIEKTLKSLESQSYDKFEVVIVNDGSTDNTESVIKKYLESSNLNVKYILQKNSGVSSARNKGLEIARGEYITFLDSDDVYNNKFIEKLLGVLVEKGVDTAYCCYSRDIDLILQNNNKKDMIVEVLHHEKLMRNFMYRIGPCAFVNFVYKKSIIDCNNIRFTDEVRYGEDLEFTWKYICHCETAAFIDENLYGYYNNPESAINTISWEITQALSSVKRVESYLANQGDNFFSEYKNYMYDRTIWAIAKDFSVNKNKELFKKFINEYDVKSSMKNMIIKSNNILIKASSIIFYINPILYYRLMSKM